MVERQSLLSKIKQKLNVKNKSKIIICAIVLIVVVAIVMCLPTANNKTNKASTNSQQTTSFNALEYTNQVSQNLQSAINSIKGISNAKVVVVVQQSPEIKYLTEQKNTDQNIIVYYKNGTTYSPAIVTEFLPKITGILVVAKGVDNLQIKNKLINAISAVYNINVSCIDILEGK